MYIENLTLTNFRNYAQLELSLPRQMVVLQGDNAQGKTNLLEAIYLLATTRSPLTTAERELIRWQTWQEPIPVARLTAQVCRAGDNLHLEIALKGDTRQDGPQSGLVTKQIKVNGLPRRAAEVVGLVNAVMFSAPDIELIGGAPALRRRYLDVTLCQVDSRYLRSLQAYNKVLLQRNHLLRLIQEREAQPAELKFWDDELVEQGSYLVLERRQLVAELNQRTKVVHSQLAPGESLTLLYLPSLGREAGQDLAQTRQAFAQALGQVQGREIAAGMSLVGPHRDDLQFLNNGIDLGIYASRGQQRTISLSLKLAEAGFFKDKRGEPPILLLDDVLSELDHKRRSYLLAWLADYEQVLLTTTEFEFLPAEFLTGAAVFQVRQGIISPLDNLAP
jgi:DNA replication and repair protein RecF